MFIEENYDSSKYTAHAKLGVKLMYLCITVCLPSVNFDPAVCPAVQLIVSLESFYAVLVNVNVEPKAPAKMLRLLSFANGDSMLCCRYSINRLNCMFRM
jgi:hypothetical protein